MLHVNELYKVKILRYLKYVTAIAVERHRKMQNHMVDFPFSLSSAFVMFVERRWAFVLSMLARRSTNSEGVWLKIRERTSLS